MSHKVISPQKAYIVLIANINDNYPDFFPTAPAQKATIWVLKLISTWRKKLIILFLTVRSRKLARKQVIILAYIVIQHGAGKYHVCKFI